MKRNWVLIVLGLLTLAACQRRVHLTGTVDWGGGAGSSPDAGDGGSGGEPIVFLIQPADAGPDH